MRQRASKMAKLPLVLRYRCFPRLLRSQSIPKLFVAFLSTLAASMRLSAADPHSLAEHALCGGKSPAACPPSAAAAQVCL